MLEVVLNFFFFKSLCFRIKCFRYSRTCTRKVLHCRTMSVVLFQFKIFKFEVHMLIFIKLSLSKYLKSLFTIALAHQHCFVFSFQSSLVVEGI